MFNVVKVLTESGNKILFSNGKGDFIVASYSTEFGRPECLLFDSNSQGEISNWTELYGSKFSKEFPKTSAIFAVVAKYNELLAKNDYVGAWS